MDMILDVGIILLLGFFFVKEMFVLLYSGG